jgi:hypothetical protein
MTQAGSGPSGNFLRKEEDDAGVARAENNAFPKLRDSSHSQELQSLRMDRVSFPFIDGLNQSLQRRYINDDSDSSDSSAFTDFER